MKKKFISVALFGAVIIASSSVLSSCKDYDDDISSVQGELHTGLDALNAQYNALNEALEAAKSEAKAAQEAATAAINEAQSTADEGVKAAAEAKAEAELAKQAAAEAKADAIAEAQKLVEEVKKMIPSTDGFITDETLNAKVEELLAKIAAVDVTDELAALKDQLNGINLDEVSSAIEQMKIQLEAVQKFESLITANQNSITDLQSKYAEINKSIETINTEMEGLAKLSDVTNLEERVKAAEEALKNVQQDVTIVNQNLVTILGKGLRGLVFYPNLFINGIEAAEYGFVRNTVMVDNKNAKLTGTDNEDNAYTLLGNHTNGRAIDYTEGSNTADVNPYVEISYHMNPSNAEVKEAGNVAFISRNAEVIGLRSTEANVGGIAAKGVSTANGKLNVKIQANGAALEKANVRYAYVNFDDENLYDLTAKDMNDVLQVLYSIYGDFTHLFLDEIQNIDGWHLFVNRMLRKGIRILLTGSNSKLLSGELASHLTGRHHTVELLPFSFKDWCNYNYIAIEPLTTKNMGLLMGAFDQYLRQGGFPELLVENNRTGYVDSLFHNIITQDIQKRFKVKYIDSLERLAGHLLNISPTVIVKDKLQEQFGFKSHHTLGNYLSYLAQVYMICKVSKYSSKSKERSVAEKVYAIDVAFMNGRENAFAGENLGWRLETIVYLELRRRRIRTTEEDIYYFDNGNTEADFVVCEGNKTLGVYQVAYDIGNPKTRRREINGAVSAARNTRCDNVFILTDHQSETIVHEGITINVMPVWEWIVREG